MPCCVSCYNYLSRTSTSKMNKEGEMVDDETTPLKMKISMDDDTNSIFSEESTDNNEEESNKGFFELLQESDDDTDVDIARKTMIGMLIVALGTGLFCSVGAVVQVHGGSVLELILGRYIIQNMISWIIWFFKKPADCIAWYGDPPHRVNIWARGCLYFCTTFAWWRGLEMVPLGDGEAVLFISPIVTVIAARVFLKEELPKTFLLTLVMSVTGLLFICQPSFIFSDSADYEPMSWKGCLFLLAAVFAWSGACLLVRTAKSAHWLQLETVSTTQAILFWCPLVILINQFFIQSDALSGGEWDFKPMTFVVMVIVGGLGFSALMLNVIGYQIGDATKVAWMEYLDLVFAFLYQWLYFQEDPNLWEIIGCCCLLLTCVTHLIEEYVHYRNAKKEDEDSKNNKEMQGIIDLQNIEDNVDNMDSTSGDELQPLLNENKDKLYDFS